MKNIIIALFFFLSIQLIITDEINQNYIQIFGEGPIGQYIKGLETKRYTKEDALNYAKNEILEYLSAMVYGYNFVYKVENKLNESEGFFDLENIYKFKSIEKIVKLTQVEVPEDYEIKKEIKNEKDKIEEDQNDFFISIDDKKNKHFQIEDLLIRFRGIYRLSEDQKYYIKGFQSSLAKMSMGEAKGSWLEEWDTRLKIYKDALRNAVLNEAKRRLKSRPLYIKGKILLIESPRFFMVSGEWVARVKIHVIILEVDYKENY